MHESKEAMPVDIGESTDLRQEVENHERRSCWEKLSRIILASGHYICRRATKLKERK
jgi:hypothetical protein